MEEQGPLVLDYSKVVIEYNKWLKLKMDFESRVKNKRFLPKENTQVELYKKTIEPK